MAFIEVVTRCYKRPEMLKRNTDSLDRQTFSDWEQTLLIDDVGIGLESANEQLVDFVPIGEYVWILDDDDMAVRDTLFGEVWQIVNEQSADMVMVKMDHGPRGVLPAFNQPPQPGAVGVSAAFIESGLWMDCSSAWASGGYMADGQFMRKAYDAAQHVVWHDVIGSRVQRISLGAPA